MVSSGYGLWYIMSISIVTIGANHPQKPQIILYITSSRCLQSCVSWHYSLQCPGVWQWELLLQGLQHPPSKISHFSKSSPNCARYSITLDMMNCGTVASSVKAVRIRWEWKSNLRYIILRNIEIWPQWFDNHFPTQEDTVYAISIFFPTRCIC